MRKFSSLLVATLLGLSTTYAIALSPLDSSSREERMEHALRDYRQSQSGTTAASTGSTMAVGLKHQHRKPHSKHHNKKHKKMS